MLPVIDRQKRVIGFGGRLLDPEAKDRKYVNSPESPLFHKKESLYGLHAALDAIRRSNTAVVVEGNFDVLALHQAGIEEAVAPMGTALTAEQVGAIGKLARTVTVVFDGDTAGQRAAAKAIPLFVEADVDGRIARMPAGVDPDDFVRTARRTARRRSAAWSRARARCSISSSRTAPSEATIDGRVATLERVAELLVRVRNQTKRELYAGQLAGVLGLASHQVTRALREAAAKASRPRRRQQPAAPRRPSAVVPAKLPAEELQVLVLLGRYPELLRTAEAARAGELLIHPLSRQLHRAAAEQAGENGKLDVAAWLDTAAPASGRPIAAALMDGGLDSAESGVIAGKVGESARDFARGRRDVDEHTFAERSAGTGG